MRAGRIQGITAGPARICDAGVSARRSVETMASRIEHSMRFCDNRLMLSIPGQSFDAVVAEVLCRISNLNRRPSDSMAQGVGVPRNRATGLQRSSDSIHVRRRSDSLCTVFLKTPQD
jgi:hypothetical protein